MMITNMKDFVIGMLIGATLMACVLIAFNADLAPSTNVANGNKPIDKGDVMYELEKTKAMLQSDTYGPDFVRLEQGPYEMCVCHAI